MTINIFALVAIIREYIPICIKEVKNNKEHLAIVPNNVDNILILLFPSPSKVKERGDCIYCKMQMGAKNNR